MFPASEFTHTHSQKPWIKWNDSHLWQNATYCVRLQLHCLNLSFRLLNCVFHVSFRLQGNSLHLCHQRSRRGQRHQPGVPWGRALHLRLQPCRSTPWPAARLAVGRLRRQRALRLPVRPGVCGRQGEGEELPTWVTWARPNTDEPAE